MLQHRSGSSQAKSASNNLSMNASPQQRIQPKPSTLPPASKNAVARNKIPPKVAMMPSLRRK